MNRKLLFVVGLLACSVIAFKFAKTMPEKLPIVEEKGKSNGNLQSIKHQIVRPKSARTFVNSLANASHTREDDPSVRDTKPVADANGALSDSAKILKNSQAIQANLRYKIEMFGQQITGPGFFVNEGKGSNRWRIELQHRSDVAKFRLAQVCDGRFFYRQQELNDEHDLSVVDLNRLSDGSTQPADSWENPWSGIGGLSSAMQHIATHFDFEPVKRDRLDQIEVYKLVGKWKPASISKLFPGYANRASPGDLLDSLPPHVPHVVQIVLATEADKFPLFPYRLVYYRFENKTNSDKQSPQDLKPTVVLEFFNLKSVDRISPGIFKVDSPTYGSTDLTEDYVEQAERLSRLR